MCYSAFTKIKRLPVSLFISVLFYGKMFRATAEIWKFLLFEPVGIPDGLGSDSIATADESYI